MSPLRKAMFTQALAVASLLQSPCCQFPVVAPRPGQTKAESAAQDDAAQHTEEEAAVPAYAVFEKRDREAFAAEEPVALSTLKDGELAVGEKPIYVIVEDAEGKLKKVPITYVEDDENGQLLCVEWYAKKPPRFFRMRYKKLKGLGAGNISNVLVKSINKEGEVLHVEVKVSYGRIRLTRTMPMPTLILEHVLAELADSKKQYNTKDKYGEFYLGEKAERAVWYELVAEPVLMPQE